MRKYDRVSVYGRTNYPSDVTDEQWQLISRLLPKPAKTGRRPIA